MCKVAKTAKSASDNKRVTREKIGAENMETRKEKKTYKNKTTKAKLFDRKV